MSRREIDAANDLFEAFHEREPEEAEIVQLAPHPGAVIFSVGELVGLIYKADGQEYIHKFKATDRPGLYVSSDGQNIHVLAGAYVFTERGFID